MSASVLLRGVDQAALVAALTRALRRAGVTVGLTGAQACVRALARTHPCSTEEIYWATRVTLVSRYEDLAAFDRVFDAAFRDSVLPVDPHAWREQVVPGSDDVHVAASRADPTTGMESSGLPWATLPPVRDEGAAEPGDLRVPERLPSAVAGLADTPFEQFGDADLAVLERWLRESLTQWPTRRSRRQRMHPAGASVALRATVARARRTGWEPVHLVRSKPQDEPRRLVMVCDVSQSMQAHTRAYLHLMRACARAADNEVFVFATTLTRLTPALRNASAQVAVDRATEQVVDRFGGTRIATNLRALLTSHRGNTLRGAIVVIASDGWDSDDPPELAAVMARLHRRAHRVLWLNPRAAAPGYEPRVGSMSAALPWCDEFMPAHDIGALADVLTAIRDARYPQGWTQEWSPPHGMARAQLQREMCTDGLNRRMPTPARRSIAWVARGVVMKRSSSSAAGGMACRDRVIALQTPGDCRCCPSMRTSRPCEMSAATANWTANVSPPARRTSSTAAASL